MNEVKRRYVIITIIISIVFLFFCFHRIHTEVSGKHVDNFTGVFTERDEMLP